MGFWVPFNLFFFCDGKKKEIFCPRSVEVVMFSVFSLSSPFLGCKCLLRCPVKKIKLLGERKGLYKGNPCITFLSSWTVKYEREKGETQRRREEEKGKGKEGKGLIQILRLARYTFDTLFL